MKPWTSTTRCLCRVLLGLALLPWMGGCAGMDSKSSLKPEADPKVQRYSQKIQRAFEMGKTLAPGNPAYVDEQGELVLAETLRVFYAPYAGAQQLLAFARRHPIHPLLPLFMEKDAEGRYFEFQEEEEFKSGMFFSNYEKTLWDPFYRQILLQYVRKDQWNDQEFLRLALGLKEAARLTPRYADFFPIELTPETRKAFDDYLALYPAGALADRFVFMELLQDRSGAWEGGRLRLDERLSKLLASAPDELLKLEIQATLDQPRVDPGRAFLASAVLPGSGQILNGDPMGGLFMAGLAGAAWWWTISRLAAGLQTQDPTDRQTAFGDAAWRAPLVVLFHGFAALNASSQARFINLSIQWDLLNEPRLKETFQGKPDNP